MTRPALAAVPLGWSVWALRAPVTTGGFGEGGEVGFVVSLHEFGDEGVDFARDAASVGLGLCIG